ncbi:MAG: OmcA/MtrC family decaheme c-type cytochrome [Holophagaceae bacterium]|nr:OmcA/MtrC family decaheme c-type cytochrome [Holophagaceae bacterium]
MQTRLLKRLSGVIAIAAFAFMLVACKGDAGQNGATGPAGPAGSDGSGGPTGPTGPTGPAGSTTIDVTQLTPDEWASLDPKGAVTSVTVSGRPVVNFYLTDSKGTGLKGFGNMTSKSSTATLNSYPNLAFALAKLIPEDLTTTSKAPSKWVSYIVTSVPTTTAAAAPTRPSTDNTGTLVDNGDGTYRYTFYRDITQMKAFLDAYTYTGLNLRADLGDTTYEPNLTHRMVVQFSGNARGTGSNTSNGVTVATAVPLKKPINLIYDFIPATGRAVTSADAQREVVAIQNCNECHGQLAFHGGGRVDTRYCVVCHNDQRKYGFKEAAVTATGYDPADVAAPAVGSGNPTLGQRKIGNAAIGDFPRMVHKIHQGMELTKTGYNYANVLFNDIGYSMLGGGQKMCSKCHDNAAQSANWNTKPSIIACGSCHDRVNFETGENHGVDVGGPKTDYTCAVCHEAADIKTYHMTENLTPHNPTVAAGLKNFTYEISSAVASPTNVVVKFRIKADGTAVTFVAPAASMANPLAGFTGGPSFLLAYAQPQDGVATPADYNNIGSGSSNFQPISVSIANLLDTTKTTSVGTLAGPDSSGYYTATIVGAAKIFPAGATLRSVSLQGYFTQISPAAARHTVSVVKAVTGDTVRRTVIDSAKCANCHEWFEGHGGNRVYQVQVCVTCHVPGLTTSGRGISDTELETYRAAGLFTAKDITNLAAWGITIPNPVPVGSNFALNFPQTTNNFKDMIHGIHAGKDRTSPIAIVRNRTPGAIAIINGGNIGFPGILNNCQSCHTYNGFSGTPANVLASRENADNGTATTVGAKASLATLNATDKMITPFTAACVTCHDSAPAQAHMTLNGGQIKVNRSALNSAGESCAVCHGAGAEFDPAKVHM